MKRGNKSIINTIIRGECLEVMCGIPDGSIDMVLCDPPYGTTACKWDTVIPLKPMWKELNRIIKPNGVIALFGTEPFSSTLRISNITNFRYDWIWNKITAKGHLVAKKVPMKQHEIISIFYKQSPTYIPCMFRKNKPITGKEGKRSDIMSGVNTGYTKVYTHSYPKSIIEFSMDKSRKHPTQKPVNLIKYLIKTYTHEKEVVLDFTIGSGTTAVAAIQTNRRFIGIEKDPAYYKIAVERIKAAKKHPKLFFY